MTETRTRVRLTFVLVVLALAGATWIAGVTLLPGTKLPRAVWQIGPERQMPEPFAKVAAFDPMTLAVTLPFGAHVYVVSFDHSQGAVTYFPTEYLGTDHQQTEGGRMNRLPAGRHAIPGTWDDKEIEWYVPGIKEALSLCVVVSRTPLPELEEILPLTRQVGNRAFRDRSMGSYMPRAGRDKIVGRRRMPHAVLQAALDHGATTADGQMVAWPGRQGVFLGTLHVLPGKARPGATAPSHPFAKQLEQTVKKKQQGK